MVRDGACNQKEAQDLMTALYKQRCTICGLPGHSSPQCWFNHALYEECRRSGKLRINYAFRAGIKAERKTAVQKVRHEAQMEAIVAAAAKEVQIRLKIAAKRAELR